MSVNKKQRVRKLLNSTSRCPTTGKTACCGKAEMQLQSTSESAETVASADINKQESQGSIKTVLKYILHPEQIKEAAELTWSSTTEPNAAEKAIYIDSLNSYGSKSSFDIRDRSFAHRLIDAGLINWHKWKGRKNYSDTPTMYKCYICMRGWWYLYDFREHLYEHIQPSRSSTRYVSITTEETTTEWYMICFLGTKPTPIEIPIAGNCPKCMRDYDFHVKKDKNVTYYTCPRECDKTSFFDTCYSAMVHDTVCIKNELRFNLLVKCKVCHLPFETTEVLNEHMSLCHDVRSDMLLGHANFGMKVCKVCKKCTFLKAIHYCPMQQPMFSCSYCSRSFLTKLYAGLHTQIMNNFVDCRVCGKELRQCTEMHHLVEHTEGYVVMYACMMCKNSFYESIRAFELHCQTINHSEKVHRYEKAIIPKCLLSKCQAVDAAVMPVNIQIRTMKLPKENDELFTPMETESKGIQSIKLTSAQSMKVHGRTEKSERYVYNEITSLELFERRFDIMIKKIKHISKPDTKVVMQFVIDYNIIYNDIKCLHICSLDNPVYKAIHVYALNRLGEYIKNEDELDFRHKTMNEAIELWQYYVLRSKHEYTPLMYKCYVCSLAWWHLSPFRDHIDEHRTENMKTDIEVGQNMRECNMVCYIDSMPKQYDIYVDGDCPKCGNDYSFHLATRAPEDGMNYYWCRKGCVKRYFATCLALVQHESYCPYMEVKRLGMVPCNFCSLYVDREHLDDHLICTHSVRSDVPVFYVGKRRSEREQGGKSVCPHCYKQFPCPALEEIHKEYYSSWRICSVCDKILEVGCTEVRHLAGHSRKFKLMYQCVVCEEDCYFLDEQAFTIHMGLHEEHGTPESTAIINHCYEKHKVFVPVRSIERCSITEITTDHDQNVKTVTLNCPKLNNIENYLLDDAHIVSIQQKQVQQNEQNTTRATTTTEDAEPATIEDVTSLETPHEASVPKEDNQKKAGDKRIDKSGDRSEQKNTEDATANAIVTKAMVDIQLNKEAGNKAVAKMKRSRKKKLYNSNAKKAKRVIVDNKTPTQIQTTLATSQRTNMAADAATGVDNNVSKLEVKHSEFKKIIAKYNISSQSLKMNCDNTQNVVIPLSADKSCSTVNDDIASTMVISLKSTTNKDTMKAISEDQATQEMLPAMKIVKDDRATKFVINLEDKGIVGAALETQVTAIEDNVNASEEPYDIDSFIEENKVLHDVDLENIDDENDVEDTVIFVANDDDVRDEKDGATTMDADREYSVVVKIEDTEGDDDDDSRGSACATETDSVDVNPDVLEPEVIIRSRRTKYKSRRARDADQGPAVKKYPNRLQAPSYDCSVCGTKSSSLYMYAKHFEGCISGSRLTCPCCHAVKTAVNSLSQHIQKHVEDRFTCCGYVSQDAAQVTRAYKCSLCQVFVSKADRFGHWEAHRASAGLQATGSASEEPQEPKQVKIETSLGPALLALTLKDLQSVGRRSVKQCVVCSRSFHRQQDCKIHVVEHLLEDARSQQQGSLLCQQCGEGFAAADLYKRHMREHARLPLYLCPICDKTFSNSSNFVKHKKIHNQLAYVCDHCGKKFQIKPTLERHIVAIHLRGAESRCPVCARGFADPSFLKKHMRWKHADARCITKCQTCSQEFSSQKEKWDHMWDAHRVRRQRADCPHCSAQYRTAQLLRRHVRKVHPEAAGGPARLGGPRPLGGPVPSGGLTPLKGPIPLGGVTRLGV